MSPRSQVLRPGSWVLGPGSWVPGPRSCIVGCRSWVLSPGYQVLVPGSRVLGYESWVPGPMSWVSGRGSWIPSPGSWSQVPVLRPYFRLCPFKIIFIFHAFIICFHKDFLYSLKSKSKYRRFFSRQILNEFHCFPKHVPSLCHGKQRK